MITSGGTTVVKKQTDHQKCNSCLYGNFFDIIVKQQNEQWYYMTKCPRCGSFDEIKEISARRAQDYIPPTLLS